MSNVKLIKQFKVILRFSGLFNIIIASMFIFPKLYEYFLKFFNWLNPFLGLDGKNITTPTDAFHALFINTAGIDLVLIGFIVLIVSTDPLNKISRKIIFANGIGRFLFTVFVIYYSIYYQLMDLFTIFGSIDFVITLSFLYFLNKTKKIKNN